MRLFYKNKGKKISQALLGILILTITFIVILSQVPVNEIEATTIVYENEIDLEQVKGDAVAEKIEILERDVVTQLSTQCETEGVEEPDGFVRLEHDGILSWGEFQFRRHTIIHYVSKLYGKDIDLRDAALIAFDAHPEISLDVLVRDMLFEAGAVDEWYNCNRKLSLEQQIELIKKLSQ